MTCAKYLKLEVFYPVCEWLLEYLFKAFKCVKNEESHKNALKCAAVLNSWMLSQTNHGSHPVMDGTGSSISLSVVVLLGTSFISLFTKIRSWRRQATSFSNIENIIVIKNHTQIVFMNISIFHVLCDWNPCIPFCWVAQSLQLKDGQLSCSTLCDWVWGVLNLFGPWIIFQWIFNGHFAITGTSLTTSRKCIAHESMNIYQGFMKLIVGQGFMKLIVGH